jgi:predicted nucleic acid-binding protein
LARVIVLDASVLIGLLDANDGFHEASGYLLSEALGEEMGANQLTLAEVLVVPAREGRVDAILGDLDDLEVAELGFPPNTPTRLAELRSVTGLKMPDCCVLLSAQDIGGTVATFDDRLRSAAVKLGLRVSP